MSARFRFRVLVIPAFMLVASTLASAQGYFRVENRQGVWWLVDAQGNPTISRGVDTLHYQGDQIRSADIHPYLQNVQRLYPDRAAWDRATLERLKSWGFNTIGAWSDPELWGKGVPYAVILDIATRAGANWQRGIPVDVYAPRFEEAAREAAQRLCAPRASDPDLIGYFSDNELRWGPDWRGKENMLAMYLELPGEAPGRRRAIEFLRHRYDNDLQSLNHDWKSSAPDFDHLPPMADTPAYHLDADDFLFEMATRYFRVSAEAIHRADPNHLYLGARFAGRPPDPALRAARVADVVSINIYSFNPRPLVEHVYAMTGKPVLITEFAFRAENSGLPNTQGAGPKVPDQAARAKAYRDYVTKLESLPEAVGYHWFEYEDEPKEGRFDGENSNYGLVNIEDKPYREFVESVKQANREARDAHQKLVTP